MITSAGLFCLYLRKEGDIRRWTQTSPQTLLAVSGSGRNCPCQPKMGTSAQTTSLGRVISQFDSILLKVTKIAKLLQFAGQQYHYRIPSINSNKYCHRQVSSSRLKQQEAGTTSGHLYRARQILKRKKFESVTFAYLSFWRLARFCTIFFAALDRGPLGDRAQS